jgi:hypothetical protein
MSAFPLSSIRLRTLGDCATLDFMQQHVQEVTLEECEDRPFDLGQYEVVRYEAYDRIVVVLVREKPPQGLT